MTSYKQGYYQKSPFVSPISAKALFFAFWIGYVLPTVAIYLPFWTLETKQALVALWQPAPLYLNIIWVVLARLLPHSPKSSSSQVPIYWIKMLHFSAVATSAAFHQILIWHVFSSGADEGLTFAKVLLPLRRSDPTMSQGLLFIFQVDFCLIMLSALLFCYIVVWDANELGMTNIEIISGFRMVLICAVMFGPGAALSMTCIWREDRMRTAALGKSKKAE